MKNIGIIVIGIIVLISVPTGVLAQTQNRVQDPTIRVETTTPSGNVVQNKNQVVTQNMGEEQQLMVATMEEESLQQASDKLAQLEKITLGGTVGNQLRTLAQDQIKSQALVSQEVAKINQRSQVVKFLIGTNFKGLAAVEKEMEQNQLRIREMEQLLNQVYNQADKTLLQENIQLLQDQYTALQDMVQRETQSFSLFGWLVKLFS